METVESPGLRIAVIGPRAPATHYSGIERLCQYLYEGLASRGHHATCFVGAHEHAALPEISTGVVLQAVRVHRMAALETITKAFAAAWAVLRAGTFDVVHIHAEPSCLILPLLAWRGIPSVVTIQGLDWARRRWRGLGGVVIRLAERFAIRYATEVIVVSEELRDYFAARGRSTTLIRNGVPPRLRDVVSPDQGARHDRPYLVTFARLVPEKRIADVIAAVLPLGHLCDLLVIGTGPEGSALADAARGQRHIHLLGHLEPEGLWRLVASAKACLSASELEGLPLAMLESLALGVPVIASDIPAHREILTSEHQAALLFPVGDTVALRQLILTAFAGTTEWKRLGQQLRHSTLERFDHRRTIHDTEAALRRAFSSTAKPPADASSQS